jgi:heterodisulfide reductase subunit A
MPANDTCRIGVYICHCGLNIASKVDVNAVEQYAATLSNVVMVKSYKFMCSDPGQQLIRDDISRHQITHLVVASCSPLMHEPTFRGVMQEAGLNPYLYQMVNIREQVSWVTKDLGRATQKARLLITAAVRRVALHDALQRSTTPINPNVLIVGAGIAGISAALTLADAGKQVYLVEREPSIGGHMAQFDKTFPTLDCAACILTPKMTQVGKHKNIHLMAYSEVQEVSGFIGSFTVKVRRKASYVDNDACTGCGSCWEACPARRVPAKRVIRMGKQIIGRTPVLTTGSDLISRTAHRSTPLLGAAEIEIRSDPIS